MTRIELMDEYEEETDESATWQYHGREFPTDDFLEWVQRVVTAMELERTRLWRMLRK